VPLVGRISGAKVYIYYDDHDPPHIHVIHAEHEAEVSIERREIMAGKLPSPLMRRVSEWIRRHRDEIMDRWELAQSLTEFQPIEENESEDDASNY
jgi:hypothetical protein